METARHAGALRCACAGKERAREPTCMQVGPKPGQRKKKNKKHKKMLGQNCLCTRGRRRLARGVWRGEGQRGVAGSAV